MSFDMNVEAGKVKKTFTVAGRQRNRVRKTVKKKVNGVRERGDRQAIYRSQHRTQSPSPPNKHRHEHTHTLLKKKKRKEKRTHFFRKESGALRPLNTPRYTDSLNIFSLNIYVMPTSILS
jgi:hypothetical protein